MGGDAATLLGLPQALRKAQRVFERTGGLHAAGLFSAEGRVVSVREDVGRHNAVDKIVGEQVMAGRVPLADHVLQVSGRLSRQWQADGTRYSGSVSVSRSRRAPASPVLVSNDRRHVPT